jgi:hypothetical protein
MREQIERVRMDERRMRRWEDIARDEKIRGKRWIRRWGSEGVKEKIRMRIDENKSEEDEEIREYVMWWSNEKNDMWWPGVPVRTLGHRV